MINIVKKTLSFFIDKELIKHASVMFTATLIGSACNYIFQLYIGRALGPSEYGIFGSLFAISYILLVLTATIQTGVARFISKFIGENNHDQINYFLRELIKKMFVLGIILVLVIILSSAYISAFLKIGSIYPVIILGTMFLFSTILPVNSGTLLGLEKFKSLGFTNVLNYFSKLIFGIVLVFIGYGINGAIGAIVVGSAISLFVSFIFLKDYLSKVTLKNHNFKFSELYKYSFPALLAMFCFTVPANVDLIIAKHVFDAHTAGLYTAATVLGKIILFIPGAIAIVMFPKISKLHTENKETSTLLLKSLFYTGGLSGSIALIYWTFPMYIVEIPYGIEYVSISPILQIYGIIMVLFSLTVVIMRYSLAVNDVKYVYILSFFTALEIILLILYNSSIGELVFILLISNILLLLSSLIYIIIKTNLIRVIIGVINNE